MASYRQIPGSENLSIRISYLEFEGVDALSLPRPSPSSHFCVINDPFKLNILGAPLFSDFEAQNQ